MIELDKRVKVRVVAEQAGMYGAETLEPATEVEVRQAITTRLQTEVAAMNLNNFII
ncbi:hypothetical protein JOY44_10975 [Phormidium sp. CLA17]|uniref:hypothetical protein n=1 Tax=Leptolyngbya sp. Cla-17 TaxID=2803751 RepID=UPI00193322EC|nr:hypothetical protein [Leptolyngbya sp. Cla-17]MBM0742139.1 hypothetical protein [Leptolyngbya sp. Cla-17]